MPQSSLVPDDVLLDIFQRALYDSSWDGLAPGYVDKPRLNLLRVAMAFSSVCRQWRSVLLESGAIWSKLLDTSYYHGNRHLWDLILGRIGKTAPIWLRCHDRTSVDAIEPHNPSSVDPSIPRAECNDIHKFVLPVLHFHADRITRFDIDVWHTNQLIYDEWTHIFEIWQQATHFHIGTLSHKYQKRHLEAQRVNMDKLFHGIIMSISDVARLAAPNLTSLRLDGISVSPNVVLGLLKLTPNLQALGISSGVRWSEHDNLSIRCAPPAQEPLVLVDMPHLRTFRVEGAANFGVAAVVFPRLKLSETRPCAIFIDGRLAPQMSGFLAGRPELAQLGRALRDVLRRSLNTFALGHGHGSTRNGEAVLEILQTPFAWSTTLLTLGNHTCPFSVHVDSYGVGDDENVPLPNWFTHAIFPPILAEGYEHVGLRKHFRRICCD